MYYITKRMARLSLGVHVGAFVSSFASLAASFLSGNVVLFFILFGTFLYSIFNLYVLLSGKIFNFVVEEDNSDPEEEDD